MKLKKKSRKKNWFDYGIVKECFGDSEIVHDYVKKKIRTKSLTAILN